YAAARAFIRDHGYDGHFFDLEVRYYDLGEWTYWSSPLAKSFEEQYMINRCRTEYTWDALAKAGRLPAEGFEGKELSLAPVLEDLEFQSLVRDSRGSAFTVFDVLGTADYEIRHSNVLSWLLDREGNHGKGSSFLDILWEEISREHSVPTPTFANYQVSREGENEDEKIDLLLVAEDRSWIVVVENKLFSPETGDQLDRYFRYIEERYRDIPQRFYFYLTPDGIAPVREEDEARWLPISYRFVRTAVARFTSNDLPNRIRDFLDQYLEHIDRNVLKGIEKVERQRNALRRHAKLFHALPHLLNKDSILKQCDDEEFEQLKSILAVQNEVERELFEFAKQMRAKHGYRRYSGLGHWFTIEPPQLRERMVSSGLLQSQEDLPIVFAFDSRPDSFAVEIWLYKHMPLFRKVRGRVSRVSEEGPEPGRSDLNLVEVLFRRTIVHPDQIIEESLDQLKERIASYFDTQLRADLEESVDAICSMLESIAPSRHEP
ncbi:PD-(D/E)XK nuclease family protein, partial [Verrucomicrobiales bacterium]|nr:PD-(D/E)XK nuclease family protein [Verrucomicrobiales bacterium]